MKPESVSTGGSFITYVRTLANTTAQAYTGSLEEYLRSVLRIVISHRSKSPSYQLLARTLTDAFSVAPLHFDSAWLTYTDPPEVVFAHDDDPKGVPAAPFGTVEHILKCQIADLRRMTEAGTLTGPFRYFGIKSPSGYTWYNFEPAGYLACAAASGDEAYLGTDCDWTYLTIFLWLGQIYE